MRARRAVRRHRMSAARAVLPLVLAAVGAAVCVAAPVSATSATSATSAASAASAASARGQLPVPWGAAAMLQAQANYLFSSGTVAGANNWGCRPSRAHPYPVVLVPATGVNVGTNWVVLSPLLADAGYCVFSFNYGQTVPLVPSDGFGDIAASARTMAAFVAHVLAVTGAKQVDVVGHSQGGMMPNYYIKFLGGAPRVHTFVALAPSNHGTDLDGLVALWDDLGVLGLVNSFLDITAFPGVAEQEAGSAFQKALFAGGDTVHGPQYWVIESDHDEVVTPYTNAWLNGPGVRNILVQQQCPADPVGHIGMFEDGPALYDVLNALDGGSPSYQPSCTNYGIGL
jgi:pimeloyl-ACP methyl ester carboxylesterase